MARLRFRHRRRPTGDAQIWNGRSARLLRRRSALDEALRLQLPRRTHAERWSGRMKFSLSWLKDHLDTKADAATVAETLTRIGIEVEGVDNPAEALKPFRIARVVTAERHPQADKLQVLT